MMSTDGLVIRRSYGSVSPRRREVVSTVERPRPPLERQVNEENRHSGLKRLKSRSWSSVRRWEKENELLFAMIEDESDWLSGLFPDEIIAPEFFFFSLEDGVLLCKLALLIQEYAEKYGEENKIIIPKYHVKFHPRSRTRGQLGQFRARENVTEFLTWCRKHHVPEVILFESNDVVQTDDFREGAREVVICLMEIARRAAKYGVKPPKLIILEKEIELEERQDECSSPTSVDSGVETENYINENKKIDNVEACDLKSRQRSDLDQDFDYADGVYIQEGDKCTASNDTSTESNKVGTKQGTKQGSTDSDIPLKPQTELDKKVLNFINEYSVGKVTRLKEGKYIILGRVMFIRMLNEHVLVRIGGGWDGLEHYLMTHVREAVQTPKTSATDSTSSTSRSCTPNLVLESRLQSRVLSRREKITASTPSLVDINKTIEFRSFTPPLLNNLTARGRDQPSRKTSRVKDTDEADIARAIRKIETAVSDNITKKTASTTSLNITPFSDSCRDCSNNRKRSKGNMDLDSQNFSQIVTDSNLETNNDTDIVTGDSKDLLNEEQLREHVIESAKPSVDRNANIEVTPITEAAQLLNGHVTAIEEPISTGELCEDDFKVQVSAKNGDISTKGSSLSDKNGSKNKKGVSTSADKKTAKSSSTKGTASPPSKKPVATAGKPAASSTRAGSTKVGPNSKDAAKKLSATAKKADTAKAGSKSKTNSTSTTQKVGKDAADGAAISKSTKSASADRKEGKLGSVSATKTASKSKAATTSSSVKSSATSKASESSSKAANDTKAAVKTTSAKPSSAKSVSSKSTSSTSSKSSSSKTATSTKGTTSKSAPAAKAATSSSKPASSSASESSSKAPSAKTSASTKPSTKPASSSTKDMNSKSASSKQVSSKTAPSKSATSKPDSSSSSAGTSKSPAASKSATAPTSSAPTTKKPSSGSTKQAPASAKPTSSSAKITSKKPASADKKPTSADKKPASADKKPASAEKKPASADKKPTPSNKKPASTAKKPQSTDTKQAAAKAKSPPPSGPKTKTGPATKSTSQTSKTASTKATSKKAPAQKQVDGKSPVKASKTAKKTDAKPTSKPTASAKTSATEEKADEKKETVNQTGLQLENGGLEQTVVAVEKVIEVSNSVDKQVDVVLTDANDLSDEQKVAENIVKELEKTDTNLVESESRISEENANMAVQIAVSSEEADAFPAAESSAATESAFVEVGNASTEGKSDILTTESPASSPLSEEITNENAALESAIKPDSQDDLYESVFEKEESPDLESGQSLDLDIEQRGLGLSSEAEKECVQEPDVLADEDESGKADQSINDDLELPANEDAEESFSVDINKELLIVSEEAKYIDEDLLNEDAKKELFIEAEQVKKEDINEQLASEREIEGDSSFEQDQRNVDHRSEEDKEIEYLGKEEEGANELLKAVEEQSKIEETSLVLEKSEEPSFDEAVKNVGEHALEEIEQSSPVAEDRPQFELDLEEDVGQEKYEHESKDDINELEKSEDNSGYAQEEPEDSGREIDLEELPGNDRKEEYIEETSKEAREVEEKNLQEDEDEESGLNLRHDVYQTERENVVEEFAEDDRKEEYVEKPSDEVEEENLQEDEGEESGLVREQDKIIEEGFEETEKLLHQDKHNDGETYVSTVGDHDERIDESQFERTSETDDDDKLNNADAELGFASEQDKELDRRFEDSQRLLQDEQECRVDQFGSVHGDNDLAGLESQKSENIADRSLNSDDREQFGLVSEQDKEIEKRFEETERLMNQDENNDHHTLLGLADQPDYRETEELCDEETEGISQNVAQEEIADSSAVLGQVPEPERVAYDEDFSVFDADDKRELIKECVLHGDSDELKTEGNFDAEIQGAADDSEEKTADQSGNAGAACIDESATREEQASDSGSTEDAEEAEDVEGPEEDAGDACNELSDDASAGKFDEKKLVALDEISAKYDEEDIREGAIAPTPPETPVPDNVPEVSLNEPAVKLEQEVENLVSPCDEEVEGEERPQMHAESEFSIGAVKGNDGEDSFQDSSVSQAGHDFSKKEDQQQSVGDPMAAAFSEPAKQEQNYGSDLDFAGELPIEQSQAFDDALKQHERFDQDVDVEHDFLKERHGNEVKPEVEEDSENMLTESPEEPEEEQGDLASGTHHTEETKEYLEEDSLSSKNQYAENEDPNKDGDPLDHVVKNEGVLTEDETLGYNVEQIQKSEDLHSRDDMNDDENNSNENSENVGQMTEDRSSVFVASEEIESVKNADDVRDENVLHLESELQDGMQIIDSSLESFENRENELLGMTSSDQTPAGDEDNNAVEQDLENESEPKFESGTECQHHHEPQTWSTTDLSFQFNEQTEAFGQEDAPYTPVSDLPDDVKSPIAEISFNHTDDHANKTSEEPDTSYDSDVLKHAQESLRLAHELDDSYETEHAENLGLPGASDSPLEDNERPFVIRPNIISSPNMSSESEDSCDDEDDDEPLDSAGMVPEADTACPDHETLNNQEENEEHGDDEEHSKESAMFGTNEQHPKQPTDLEDSEVSNDNSFSGISSESSATVEEDGDSQNEELTSEPKVDSDEQATDGSDFVLLDSPSKEAKPLENKVVEVESQGGDVDMNASQSGDENSPFHHIEIQNPPADDAEDGNQGGENLNNDENFIQENTGSQFDEFANENAFGMPENPIGLDDISIRTGPSDGQVDSNLYEHAADLTDSGQQSNQLFNEYGDVENVSNALAAQEVENHFPRYVYDASDDEETY